MATYIAYVLGIKDETTGVSEKDTSGNPVLRISPRTFIPGINPPDDDEIRSWARWYGDPSDLRTTCNVDWDFEPIIDSAPDPVFVFGQHKVEHLIDVTSSAQWRGSMDFIDCNEVRFWAVNLSDPSKPTTMRLFKDGAYIGRATVSHARKDVVDSFALQGIALPTNLLGGRIAMPETVKDGQPHTYTLFFEETNVEIITYYVSNQITCALPPPNEYIKSSYIKVSPVYEAGPEVKFQAFDVYNTGVEKLRTGFSYLKFEGLTFSINTRNPTDTGEAYYVQLADNIISEDKTATVILQDASFKELDRKTVQFINKNNCTRTGNLTTVNLSYRLKSTAGPVYGYPTLTDANTIAGKKFDGSLPGDLDSFTVQIEGFYIGAKVFLGTGSDCSVASDNAYYVIATDGTNLYKVAIQVYGGKIVDIKYSTYSTNTPPIAGKIPDQTIIQGTSLLYIYDQNLFTDPGDSLVITPVTLPNGVNFNAADRKFTGGSNLGISSYPVKIRATDSVGQSIDAPFTLNVVAASKPYIESIAIYYPQYWRSLQFGSYHEVIGIFVKIAGPGAENALGVYRYTNSVLYTANDQLIKGNPGNATAPPLGSYNRSSPAWYDENPAWSAITRQITVSISGVPGSAVTVPIRAVIGTPDLTITQIYP